MADTFIGGLVVGLVILAALLLVFNASWSSHSYAYASSGSGWFASAKGPQPELILAELGASYQVGNATTSFLSEIELGEFDISAIPTEEKFSGGLVQSGVLFGEQTLSYSVKNPEFITFTVTRTNGYSPIIIKANGEIVETVQAVRGYYFVLIDMTGDVEIEISVESSAWKLWAPALYDITDVKIRSSHPEVQYDFESGENFSGGELEFALDSGRGSLNVALNGDQLWRGTPSTTYAVALDGAEENTTNTLTITARDGSAFTGSAVLRLVNDEPEYKSFETTFTLTSAQVDKLPGYIVFEVSSIARSGTIVVKLVAGNQTKLAEAIDTEVKTHAVAFYKSNIIPGQPTKLVIESSDALFKIRNLKIWV